MRHYHNAREISRRIPAVPEHHGKIRWFDAAKGIGWIIPDAGGEDIFVHVSALIDDHVPLKGDAVLFSAGWRKGRYGATAVRVP